ncbi:MAG: SDR family oxidoreductase [Flavobacteriaceae bacterium]
MAKSKWTNFKNKTVLVTGASSGIGLAMAEDLANRGANLILVARSENKLHEVAKTLRKAGSEATVFISDLSIPNAGEKLYQEIVQSGLSVDLLINNAGYGRWGEFTDFRREDYAKMIQLNITVLTDLCHLFLPEMIKRGNGGIINVASVAAFGPVPYGNVYSATKSYVLNFTEALRYEYQNKGIQIMTLCPGGTKSNFANVASEKLEHVQANAKAKEASLSALSAEVVAKECLDAFLKNKMYVVTGTSNKLIVTFGRFLPRRTVLNMAGNMFKKIGGK